MTCRLGRGYRRSVSQPPAVPERQRSQGRRDARRAGRESLRAWQQTLSRRLLERLRDDPELLDNLSEVGVVRREWVESGGDGPITRGGDPVEMVERLLQRSVERKPSLLAQLGLSAISVLAQPRGDDDGDGDAAAGTPTRLVVAFTDLEGFTEFTATEGDAAASRLLADHHRVVGPVVRGRGGRLVKRLGDGLLLTFPEAEAGVLACLELVDTGPEPLRLRAGLHLGTVIVTADDLIGHVVNVASRVAQIAEGGEVRVTSDVRTAIADDLPRVTFGAEESVKFKGLEAPVAVCVAAYAPAG